MALADLIRNTEKQGVLVPRIEEYLMLRDGDDRRDGYFHPSDLSYNFCPRSWALYNFHPDGKIARDSSIDPRLKRIFDNGHRFHDRIQRYFQEMGLLWGTWRRPAGIGTDGTVLWEYQSGFPPRTPSGAIDLHWTYTEVKIRHEEDNIRGHTDGLLLLDGQKWGLEGKSINERGFSWLDGAKDHHKSQVRIYEHCLEDDRQERARKGELIDKFDAMPLTGFVVLYECKNDQVLQEEVMRADKTARSQTMNDLRPRMQEALAYKTTKKWPVCRCPKKQSSICKALG